MSSDQRVSKAFSDQIRNHITSAMSKLNLDLGGDREFSVDTLFKEVNFNEKSQSRNP
jgi:hypothetical protein